MRHLRRAIKSRERLEIEPMHASVSSGRMYTQIEAIGPRHMVISRPTGPGAHRPLIRFGQYTLLIPQGDRQLAGSVKVLAREQLSAGDGETPLYCYRLSYPREFESIDRTESERVLFGGNMDCEARVRAIGRAAPIFGGIVSLTAVDIRISCRHDVSLPAGASVNVEAVLPMPIGSFRAVGEIVGFERGEATSKGPIMRVKFDGPQAAIQAALRNGIE